MSEICPKCGKEIKEGLKFCPGCGAPVGGIAQEAKQMAPYGAPRGWGQPAITPLEEDRGALKKQKTNRFKMAVAIVTIVCLLAAGGFAAFFLLRGKGDGGKRAAGKVKVRGRVVIPEGVSLEYGEIGVSSLAQEEPVELDNEGYFEVEATNGATTLFSASDSQGRLVMEGILPVHPEITDFDFEISPESTATSMLFLTPGITIAYPVPAYLITSAMREIDGVDALAVVITDEMRKDPAVMDSPTQEIQSSAGDALVSFLEEVQKYAPPETESKLGSGLAAGSSGFLSGSGLQMLNEELLVSCNGTTGGLFAQAGDDGGGGSWGDEPVGGGGGRAWGGPINIQDAGGYNLNVDLLPESYDEDTREVTISWDNPLARWVMLYQDPSGPDDKPVDEAALPAIFIRPRNFEIPGLSDCIAALVVGGWERLCDEWSESFAHATGEKTITYEEEKPLLSGYGGYGSIENVPNNPQAHIRQCMADLLTVYSLFVEPLIDVLLGINPTEIWDLSVEMAEYLASLGDKYSRELADIRNSGGDYIGAMQKICDLIMKMKDDEEFKDFMQFFLAEVTDQAIDMLGNLATKLLVKIASAITVVLLVIELGPFVVNMLFHLYFVFEMQKYSQYNYYKLVPTNGGPDKITMSDTVLVMDVSGSMEGQKIEDAKSSAIELVRMIKNESNTQGVDHKVGLVVFSDEAEEKSAVTPQLDTLTPIIDNLEALSSTNMEDGIKIGTSLLKACPEENNRIMLLLSDGCPNVGASTEDELIAGVVDEARNAGITIYTVGFGSEGTSDFNETLLRAIASATGGSYLDADNYFQLTSAYIEMRHAATGDVIYQERDVFIPGQGDVKRKAIKVPPGQGELNGTLNWVGEEVLAFRLVDPDGVAVDSTYPGAQISSEGEGFFQFIIKNPRPGDWTLEIIMEEGSYQEPESRLEREAVRGAVACESMERLRTAQDGEYREDGEEIDYQVVVSTKGERTPVSAYPKILLVVLAASIVLAALAFLIFYKSVPTVGRE